MNSIKENLEKLEEIEKEIAGHKSKTEQKIADATPSEVAATIYLLTGELNYLLEPLSALQSQLKKEIKKEIKIAVLELEVIKADLRWQLSNQEIDWDYFLEITERAKIIRGQIEKDKVVNANI